MRGYRLKETFFSGRTPKEHVFECAGGGPAGRAEAAKPARSADSRHGVEGGAERAVHPTNLRTGTSEGERWGLLLLPALSQQPA